MATIFTAPGALSPASSPRDAGETITQYAELALTVAPVINDVYQMIKVPAGARGTRLEPGDEIALGHARLRVTFEAKKPGT